MKLEYPDGATPLDAAELEGLKLAHISTQGELNRWEQENIQEALAWLERRRRTNILTEDFVCRLHRQMYGKVWSWAGTFRRTDKNIGVPWTLIPQRLQALLSDVQYWIDNKTYQPNEIAYRFHHLLVQIHLFANGNGRHARMITDVLLTEVLKRDAFTWGRENLQTANEVRTRYIAALKAADNFDYSLLAAFVRS
jgi:Fic-DOC domain mobile mystery protein B